MVVPAPSQWELSNEGMSNSNDVVDTGGAYTLIFHEKEYVPTGQIEENWTQKIVGKQTRVVFEISPFDVFLSLIGGDQCDFEKWDESEVYRSEGRIVVEGYHLCSREKLSGLSKLVAIKIIETKKNLFYTSRMWRDEAVDAKEIEGILQKYSGWKSWLQDITVCGPRDKTQLCTGTDLPGSI